eukprot:m.135713 g.135713  ORF g.135713 m.135713 type:complete len:58 (+) comp22616_c0_seq1:650-823(+)
MNADSPMHPSPHAAISDCRKAPRPLNCDTCDDRCDATMNNRAYQHPPGPDTYLWFPR